MPEEQAIGLSATTYGFTPAELGEAATVMSGGSYPVEIRPHQRGGSGWDVEILVQAGLATVAAILLIAFVVWLTGQGSSSNTDSAVASNTNANSADLSQHQVSLLEGQLLTLYSDDLDEKGQMDELLVEGVVTYSEEEHNWVAVIDWSQIHLDSDRPRSPSNRPRARGACGASIRARSLAGDDFSRSAAST